MLTYFYEKSDSLIANKPFNTDMLWLHEREQLTEDAADINVKHQARNTRVQSICNFIRLKLY
jgi:hypothetical protein